MEDDIASSADVEEAEGPTEAQVKDENGEQPESERRLVARILRTIKADKRHHSKAFDRMKRDMRIAWHGADPKEWSDKNYRANLSGRLVKKKVAALYAKNPKAVARRKERLDFTVWDETLESLLIAYQTVQAGQIVMQASAAAIAASNPTLGAPPALPLSPLSDPMTAAQPPLLPELTSAEPQQMGATLDPQPIDVGAPPSPLTPPGFEQAMALLNDFQQGMARRQMLDRLAKTLELLFHHFVRSQKPLDFKSAMKSVVRRALTTGVGYVEIDFVRETGPREGLSEQIADYTTRAEHLRRLAEEAVEGEIESIDAEIAELELGLKALMSEPEVVISSGLIFDFPRSTKVIPDRSCKSLVGFIGSEHLTIEYDYTLDRVKEEFGVDLGKNYTPYKQVNDYDTEPNWNVVCDDDSDYNSNDMRSRSSDLVRVWKYYDKPSGLVYYVADGYTRFLREPTAPNVFVEGFWPVYALAFNECESESELFPPSDVSLINSMQQEHNRSRQGKREHRQAARPRWGYAKGALDEEGQESFEQMRPFEARPFNLPPGAKLADVLQNVPVPGVDPNLYDTGEIFSDMQIVVGASESVLGGLSKASATESSIAASSAATTDDSNVDDLDAFLTRIAEDSGCILQKEMAEDQVKKIVGPGAVWPQTTLEEIVGEIYLEFEAGSSGRPNQAVDLNNWKTMLPFLLQMGSIDSTWLARETLRRLDDRMDLTGAITAGLPAIVAQNRMAQPAPQDPSAAPEAQGQEGADKTPSPKGGETGSDAAFGSNQV